MLLCYIVIVIFSDNIVRIVNHLDILSKVFANWKTPCAMGISFGKTVKNRIKSFSLELLSVNKSL